MKRQTSMCKRQSQVKSALALIVILAALIIPLYDIQPVSATVTHTFYGGAMPASEGGLITSIHLHITDLDTVPYDTLYVNVTQGGTTIAYFSVAWSAPTSYAGYDVTVSPTAGFNNTLIVGQTYSFVYTQGSYPLPTLSDVYVSYTPRWSVEFDATGLDSTTITSNTIVVINGTSIPYSSFSSNIYYMSVTDGDTLTYSFSGTVNSTISTKQFALTGTTPSSPQTVTSGLTVIGAYLPYTSSSIYRTTIKGPYFEDGSIATGNSVNYTLSYVNGTVYTGTLTSTGSAGSVSLVSLSAYVQLTWNASSTSATFNATRVFTFANGQNGIDDSTVYLYILNPTKPAYQYTFSITDFYGMVNPFLQTSISGNGNTSTPVERVNLKDGGGFVTFVLQQYQLYGLTFICQQGTYSQSITPILLGTPGQNVITMSVTAGNFPVSNSTGVTTTTATRIGTNAISASYYDPNATTTWVYAAITHLQGSTTITDYVSSNSTGSSQSWSWTLADANTNYYVTITAFAGGELQTYKLAVPAVYGSNPWAGLDWSYLGRVIPTLPTTYTGWGGIDPTQMIAVFLILAALGIGSYFSTGASCLICWVIGGLLLAMGWWQGSIPLFAFSGVVTIWILIDEYKKGNFNL